MEPGAPAAPAPTEESGRVTLSLLQISVSKEFALSVPGILRAIQTVLSLVAFICAVSARVDVCDLVYGSTYNYFEFVSLSAFLTGLLLYFIWLLTLQEKLCFKFLPWNWVLLIWGAVYVFFFLIGSAVIAAHACGQSGNAAAAVFGFMTLAVLGLDLGLGVRDFLQTRRSGASSKQPETSETDPPQY